MAQGVQCLAATSYVLTHLCGSVSSQGVVRVRPAEFFRPKQPKIWPCEGMVLQQLGVLGKMAPVLELHNSVLDSDRSLILAGLCCQMRLVDLPLGGGVGQAWGKVKEVAFLPEPLNSVPISA